MKKSNVILTAVAVIASALLLWLWYNLGFNKVDEPLDLVMSIIWWALIVAGGLLVAKVEKTRRENVRTVYVGDGRFYNSESGLLTLGAGSTVVDSVAAVLASLDYGFDHVDAPDPDDENSPKWTHVIHTTKYEPARNDGSDAGAAVGSGAGAGSGADEHRGETWEGEVAIIATGNKVSFYSREELARIIG